MLMNSQTHVGDVPVNFVRLALRMRIPFAMLAIFLASLGIFAFILVSRGLAPSLNGIVTMHPVIGACVIGLGLCILKTRRFGTIGVWYSAVLSLILLICAARLMDIAMFVAGGGNDAALFGPIGDVSGSFSTEAAVAIGAFSAAAILRHADARLGGLFMAVGLGFVLNTAIELTYGIAFFDGTVSILTRVCLVSVAGVMLCHYLSRPFVRAILLKGPFGAQTRAMIVIAIGLPWSVGFAVIVTGQTMAAYGAAVMSLLICVTVWILLAVTSRNEGKAVRNGRTSPVSAIQLGTNPITETLAGASMADVVEAAWLDFCSAGNRSGLIFLDLNYFRALDDAFGKGDGEDATARLIKTLRTHLRRDDTVGRWGADRLLIVLKIREDSDLDRICGRLRVALADAGSLFCVGLDLTPATIDVAFGTGVMLVSDEGPETVLMRADKNLDRSKRRGAGRMEIVNSRVSESFLFADDAAYEFSKDVDIDASSAIENRKTREKAGQKVGVKAA